MWNGGVRVAIPDADGRILMVCQEHEGRQIWMLPGGGVEKNENSREAAIREALEETGLEIAIHDLLWHIEEVSEQRGQRFVNFFLARQCEGSAVLGADPEFDEDSQVLKELRFVSQEEICDLPVVYPDFLRLELWPAIHRSRSHAQESDQKIFRIRTKE